jgi:hypothetical protein
MKINLALIIVVISGIGFTGKATVETDVFEQLYALEGKWVMQTKKGAIGEEWKKMNAQYLQNSGYTIRGVDTIINERVALRHTADGIFYISTVEAQNQQQPISFKLISWDNQAFVFENAAHDFPKKITYHFIHKDSLVASIDDGKKLPQMQMVFKYARQH